MTCCRRGDPSPLPLNPPLDYLPPANDARSTHTPSRAPTYAARRLGRAVSGHADPFIHLARHSNVRPTKPASASTAAVLVAGRLVAELLLIHAPVSLARDRACEASPVLGHHQLGLLLAKETEHNKVGHRVQLGRSGGHLSRAMLYEQEERPCVAMRRGPGVMAHAGCGDLLRSSVLGVSSGAPDPRCRGRFDVNSVGGQPYEGTA